MFFLGIITVATLDDGNSRTATRSSLDLATKTTHDDTVLEAGLGGNGYKVAFVADAAGAVTIAIDAVLKVVTVHFHDAVSTVDDVEDAIEALTVGVAVAPTSPIRVKTPGTGATVLHATVDEFAATALAGGTGFSIGLGAKALYLESDTDGVQFEVGSDSASKSSFFTTVAKGSKLYNASGPNTQEGPYPLGEHNGDAILAIHNPTGGGVNVRVWGALAGG